MSVLVIDDIRIIKGATQVCRTAAEAYIVLDSGRMFNIYYFDHDLGSTNPGTSGFDILTYALQNEKINKAAMVVLMSSNPVGRQKQQWALESHGWNRARGCATVYIYGD